MLLQVLDLSVKKGFTAVQNLLLSVIFLISILLKQFHSGPEPLVSNSFDICIVKVISFCFLQNVCANVTLFFIV